MEIRLAKYLLMHFPSESLIVMTFLCVTRAVFGVSTQYDRIYYVDQSRIQSTTYATVINPG